MSYLLSANGFSFSELLHVIIISVGLLFSLILALLSCLWFRSLFTRCFPHSSSFKDLENEDTFFSDIAISTVPSVSFQMYPPVVNSMYNNVYSTDANNSSVYFEPLPDLRSKQKKFVGRSPNETQLYPKIAHLNFKVPLDFLEFEMRKKLDYIHGLRDNAFTRSQLQYIKELGTSRFGKVLQGEGSDIQPGKKKLKVVVMMCHDDMPLKDKFIFLHEASAFKELDSRNVLKLYCQCVESSPYLTILESCSLGDLKSYMRGQKLNIEKMLDGDVILSMICDVVAGLQAIHNINFVHRDLSMRSCLITNDLTVKIGDYGLNEYKFKEDYYYDSDGVGIPIRWMAPESLSFSDGLRVNDITKKSNIWSFGVLMWELLRCGDLPYPGLSDQHVLRLVVMEKEVKLSRPILLNDNVPYFYELMEMCWNYETDSRPSIRELRISLLHLTSSKHQINQESFDEKWNQLKPKPIQSKQVDQSATEKPIALSSEDKNVSDVAIHSKSANISDSANNDDGHYDSRREISSKVDDLAFLDVNYRNSFSALNNAEVSRWNNQSGLSNQASNQSRVESNFTEATIETATGDELSSHLGAIDENSFLKIEKYTNYFNTVPTSLENEDSFVSNFNVNSKY